MATDDAVVDVEEEAPQDVSEALAQVPSMPAVRTIPSPGEMSVIRQLVADLAPLVGTDFLPRQIDNPHKALAIVLKGRELDIPPMEALAQLYVVNGRVTMQAQLMLALIARSGKGSWTIEESTDERCTVTMERSDNGTKHTLTFTIEEAENAGLLERWDNRKGKMVPNEVWHKYRPAMLRARAISACARIVFPDVIGGLYTPEELDVPVDYDEDNDEIIIDAEAIDLADLPNVGAADDSPDCPKCGAPMKRRSGKRGPFWGCSKYPDCKGTREIDDTGDPQQGSGDDPEDVVHEGQPADEEEDPFGEAPSGTEQRLPVDPDPEMDGDWQVPPTDWEPHSLEELNECVKAMEWSDADRKKLYKQACEELWGGVVGIETLNAGNFTDLFRKMVEIQKGGGR